VTEGLSVTSADDSRGVGGAVLLATLLLPVGSAVASDGAAVAGASVAGASVAGSVGAAVVLGKAVGKAVVGGIVTCKVGSRVCRDSQIA
jgi:hypothetical protein